MKRFKFNTVVINIIRTWQLPTTPSHSFRYVLTNIPINERCVWLTLRGLVWTIIGNWENVLGLPYIYFMSKELEHIGKIDLLKGGNQTLIWLSEYCNKHFGKRILHWYFFALILEFHTGCYYNWKMKWFLWNWRNV